MNHTDVTVASTQDKVRAFVKAALEEDFIWSAMAAAWMISNTML